jgi:hypothetical protein
MEELETTDSLPVDEVETTTDLPVDYDEAMRQGSEAIFELLETFPALEIELLDLYVALVFKEIDLRQYEIEVRRLCMKYITQLVVVAKHGVKADKKRRLVNAYFDVARYQTDRIDAAIEWDVDKYILGLLLERRPPPQDYEERKRLPVPSAVIKKREL